MDFELDASQLLAIQQARAALADADRLAQRCREAGLDCREREMYAAALRERLDRLEKVFGQQVRA